MAEDKESGCGISRVWMTSRDDKFFMSCKMHDGMYTEGSPIQELLTRKEADKLFLNHMLTRADSLKDKARAYLYYAIVRVVGWMWWEGK